MAKTRHIAALGEEALTRSATAPTRGWPVSIAAAMSPEKPSACSLAPPCTSPSTLTADAMALLMPTPQVAAMRAIAMERACGT
ncbi:MAG: hypothetical protein ABW003_25470 [Microvirga sp.]